ncbi:MAG: transcriptional repressor LexA [Candidatus Gracilibacteria bacterium]|jgi:repressor LexA
MSDVLTEKQEAVLKFIEEFQMSFGKSPTLREMREHFGVSSDNSILKHLNALKEKGFIQKDDTPRGIQLLSSIKEKLDHASESVKLPVLGFIPAGGPVISEEYISGYMTVGEELAKSGGDFFLLNVTGNSMIDAGIYEGDLVVVNGKKEAKNGDIVVALIDNANTLKRFIKKEGKVYLKAENKDYRDIHPENELVVQGVVTALIRQY